jgi:hypothetical protein
MISKLFAALTGVQNSWGNIPMKDGYSENQQL